jgi:hypothetical protein
MKRVLVSTLAGLAVAVFARTAAADDRSGILTPQHRTFESPQHWMFELRFGPYRPDIDSDPALNGATPYNDVFGTPPHLYYGIELDYQLYRIPGIGTLGPGISIGRVGISRQAAFATPRADGQTVSAENTSLEIFPMTAVGVLRVDHFMRENHVPLVPYAKAGLGLAFWRGYSDSGTTVVDGVAAKGHTFGTHFALGLSLHLNGLDSYAARNFDNAMGVNHTYLYFEYYMSNLTGIGQSDALRVGNSSWVLGLSFEF